MIMRYYLQKIAGWFLNKPLFRKHSTIGFSLVRSEKNNVKMGRQVCVYTPFFMKDIEIGDYGYIATNCRISNMQIGKFCSIGPNFCCGLGIHPVDGISTHPMFYSIAKQNGTSLCQENKIEESKTTYIGHDVFIGANVTVLDGVKIGDGAVVGAGAVVSKDIPPYAIAVGVPAKVVKYRFSEEQIARLLERKWWNDEIADLQNIERNFWDVNKIL